MKFKFLLILTLAFMIRFYQLGQNPPSLNWDEVSNGYNAYSILKTAKDEYGKFLPLYNRSFDDYKPPLYMYLNVLSVWVFGLNEFAVRLPSAFFGTLSVGLVYFLTRALTKSNKTSFVAMFLFTITPWTLQFSRVGFEANVSLFFNLLTFTSFLYAINQSKNKKIAICLLIISALSLGLVMYSYHSSRLFAPLMTLVFLAIFLKSIYHLSKTATIACLLLLLVIVIPNIFLLPKEAISSRYEATTYKAREEDLQKSIKLITEDQALNQRFASKIHNRRIIITISTFQKYLSHFDINFLFLVGDDNLRHHIAKHGLMYLFQLPLLLAGLYQVLKSKSKEGLVVLSWLIIAPIPASFGDAFPHAVRSLNVVLPLTILSAVGFTKMLETVKRNKTLILTTCPILILTLVSFTHNYFTHYPEEEAASWLYGYKEAVQKTAELKNKYERVIIDSSIEQAYVFWLFYTKEDPRMYHEEGSKHSFSRYYFETTEIGPKDLFVSMASKFPSSYEAIYTINYQNGSEAIKIGVTKQNQ